MDKKKIEEAIKKITEEMENVSNPYVKVIGDYVLKHIELNGQAVEEILKGKKTVSKSLDEVKKVAKTRAINGCAVMSDEEVFTLVRNYFEFEAVQDKFIQVQVEEIKEDYKIEKKDNIIYPTFNANLEDFF